MSTTPPVPPGWYTDPSDASRARYWNGTSWQAQTRPLSAPPPPPTPPGQSTPSQPPPLPPTQGLSPPTTPPKAPKGNRARNAGIGVGGLIALVAIIAIAAGASKSNNAGEGNQAASNSGSTGATGNTGSSDTTQPPTSPASGSAATTTPTSPPTTAAPTTTTSPAQYEASCTGSPSYGQLDSPNAPNGQCVTYQAKVFQYDTTTGANVMLVDVTNDGYGLWTDVVQLNIPDSVASENLVENDIIQIWGTTDGSNSYQTRAGGSNTVPVVDVQYATLVSSGG